MYQIQTCHVRRRSREKKETGKYVGIINTRVCAVRTRQAKRWSFTNPNQVFLCFKLSRAEAQCCYITKFNVEHKVMWRCSVKENIVFQYICALQSLHCQHLFHWLGWHYTYSIRTSVLPLIMALNRYDSGCPSNYHTACRGENQGRKQYQLVGINKPLTTNLGRSNYAENH